MRTQDDLVTALNTDTLLHHAYQRQQASQLVLLAVVDKEPRTLRQVQQSLLSCLPRLRALAQKDFYFDLGWLENVNTILNDFVSLNWLDKHQSTITYQSTKIGRGQLAEQWGYLQNYLGMTLEQFQEIC